MFTKGLRNVFQPAAGDELLTFSRLQYTMQEHVGERSLFIYKIISFAKENFCNEYMKVEFKTSFQNIIIFNCLLY